MEFICFALFFKTSACVILSNRYGCIINCKIALAKNHIFKQLSDLKTVNVHINPLLNSLLGERRLGAICDSR